LEPKLVGRSPEEVQAVLDQFAREWVALKGEVAVARLRFKAQADERQKLVAAVEDAKEPAGPAPLVLAVADVDRAIDFAQRVAGARAARVKALEAAYASTQALLKLNTEFTHTHVALLRYRDRLRVVRKLAGNQPAVKMPDVLAEKAVDADVEQLRPLAEEVERIGDEAGKSVFLYESSLKSAKEAAAAANKKLEELKAASGTMRAAFEFGEKLKAMQPEPLAGEFNRLRKELVEKSAAIKGNADDYAKATAAVADARAKLDAVKEPAIPPEEKLDASLPPLERAARKLFAAQQQYAARLRATDDRAEKAKALVAALDELQAKAEAYLGTLDRVREAGAQLAAVVAEIQRRVGRGDLEAAKVPDGVAEAAAATGDRAKLEADIQTVRDAIEKVKQERDALRRPDAEAESIRSQTAGLHALVGQRLDLLADLKKLAADYATARADRPESEQKRMDQRAADRASKEAGQLEPLLALERSRPATDIAALLDAYYKELVDLDEKDDNLRRQREALEKLVKLAQTEADDVAKLRAVVERHAAKSEAAKRWDDWLAARLSPGGLKAESGIYHDEAARLKVVGGANARRVETLTGNPPAEPGKGAPRQAEQPAAGGEIAKARGELMEARARGFAVTGGKVALVLLGALILPWLAVRVLRRAIRGGTDDAGNTSPVLGALRGALKIGVWVAALALVLHILGYDVTALVVALAIAVLAVALAARPMIADVLGSLVIFAERRFKVGDVVRLGPAEPARVVGITWRSTTLKSPGGLETSVPNRTVTETTVENLSKGTDTYDSLAVTVSTDKDAGKVINVIRAAVAQCKNVSPEHGVTVLSFNQKGLVKVVQYRFWWFLKDYETRNKTRDEVFARIALGLSHEDMTGIEITLG
jgi:small-conductance mechanosensitive channel